MNDQDITQEFDAPTVEPVKGFGDVRFERANLEYWASWASALKQKRLNEFQSELDKLMGISPIAKAQAKSDAKNKGVQLYEVMDLQYVPEGIDKITTDAYQRAGGDMGKWPAIKKRIGPRRLQQLATEICSEPVPTTIELREALRDLLRRAHKAVPAGIDSMNDEELIEASRQYQPVESSSGGDGPLSDRPANASGPESTGDSTVSSSVDGSESTQAA